MMKRKAKRTRRSTALLKARKGLSMKRKRDNKHCPNRSKRVW